MRERDRDSVAARAPSGESERGGGADVTGSPPLRLNRRSALVCLASAGMGIAGCSPPPSLSPVRSISSSAPRRPTDEPSWTRPSATPSATPPDLGPLTTRGPDLVRGPHTSQAVALTFHGAGSPELARRLLKIVAGAGVKVTVFAVGQWLLEHRTLGADLLRAGHQLGNHTWSHQVMTRLDLAEATREVQRGADAVATVLGHPGLLFRPSGTPRSNSTIRTAANASGYPRCISYDVDSMDYLDPGPTAVRTRTLAEVRAGSIVSMHLGHAGTVDALPGILSGLADKGLRLVTISAMFQSG